MSDSWPRVDHTEHGEAEEQHAEPKGARRAEAEQGDRALTKPGDHRDGEKVGEDFQGGWPVAAIDEDLRLDQAEGMVAGMVGEPFLDDVARRQSLPRGQPGEGLVAEARLVTVVRTLAA